MENLLNNLKQSFEQFVIAVYKFCVFCKEKWAEFIDMLKRVFGKNKKQRKN